jgi:hypothetical protein
MRDCADSASEEYRSEHDSDREFIEYNSQPYDGDFWPESEEPGSEDFTEDPDENFGHVSVN